MPQRGVGAYAADHLDAAVGVPDLDVLIVGTVELDLVVVEPVNLRNGMVTLAPVVSVIWSTSFSWK